MLSGLRDALRRTRPGLGIVAATYALSLSVGTSMVHADNPFALRFRDSLVAHAHRRDPAARANDAGARGTAAAIDFSRNLGLAAIPETIGGLTLVLPIAMATYRGWVGGIVSVDRRHRSRFRTITLAVYYVGTLLLQLAAFTLAGAGGLHLGWAYLRRRGPFVGPRWFRLPGPALRDAAWLYALVVPLFVFGSVWEFFWPAV